MMGTKIRSFSPLPPDLSLEDLVPQDHFYRRLQARLDLSFVRELVTPLYAGGGRLSVDAVVFFELQLVMFFEDIRSERQLMEVVSESGSDSAWRFPAASSRGSSRSAWRPGWFGARSTSSTRPRWRPTPPWRAGCRGSLPRPTWANSSRTREQTRPKQQTRPQTASFGPRTNEGATGSPRTASPTAPSCEAATAG